MTLNRLKLLSCILAADGILSAVPSLNVSAAEAVPHVNDILNQYVRYTPDILCENIPGLDTIYPLRIEVVNDYSIDGNYIQQDLQSETRYNADGSVNYSYEYEYDPATGKLYKTTYRSSSYSEYDIHEYDSAGRMTRYNVYKMDGRFFAYCTYQYDDSDLKSCKHNILNSNGELSSYSTTEYEYWDNGNIKRYEYHSYDIIDGEAVEIHGNEQEFNENEDILNAVYYAYDFDEDSFYEQRYEYIYTPGEYGYQALERCNIYGNGQLKSYETYDDTQVDENTQEYNIYLWNADDTPGGSYKYILKKIGDDYYDSESFEYSEDGSIFSRTVYDYEGDRLLKETVYDINGNITSWTEYEYTRNEFYDNGHYVPNFDAYVAPENCVFQYRLYNPNSGEHFYTGSEDEVRNLAQVGWNFEGSGFIAPNAGNAIYRLYSEEHGDHFYTTDVTERDAFVTDGWTVEGIAFPSVDASVGRPMYRLYNPNAYNLNQSGAYHYTMSEQEKDNLITAGWNYQGIAWYSV